MPGETVKLPPRRSLSCTPEEWAIRVDLAACYRLIERLGLTDLIYNHITARVPGNDHAFVINPFGLHYSEVCASNLVKIDLEGTVLDGSRYGINKAGYVIHSAIHGARDDVECVLHTHSDAGAAVSCLEEGFIPMTQAGFQFHNRLAYHDYEGIALDTDERARLVADLGSHNAMILRNHGLITCGASVAHAFKRLYYLEQACRVQLDVMKSGGKMSLPPPEVREKTARQFEDGYSGRSDFGTDDAASPPDWTAQLRLLDREDPSFRE